MTDRWWAPQRATLEPDAVVLAMLEPGDLGSSVLAVHRAGAAGIRTVATAALPTEKGLIGAMSTVRANVAGQVVDSVSKSADGSYAGLFVMDVFDDAEEGAVQLYRTAIAKGVAPPIAAQRAGDIFGVPSSHLGKYLTTAVDPRANPVVVQDLADRTLLEYVSQLVDAEKDDVGKASTGGQAQAEEPSDWRESDVVRDALGRFAEEGHQTGPRPGSQEWLRAQLGLDQSAPTEVAGAPVRERKAMKRAKRLVRTKRATRHATSTATARRETVRAKAQRVTQRAKTEREMKRAAAQREIARTVNRKALVRAEELERKITPGKWHGNGDLLNTFGEPSGDYGRIEHDLVLRTDQGSAAAFRVALRDQSARFSGREMVFRLGHLMQATAGNSSAERPGSKYDTDNLEGLASVVSGGSAGHQDVTILHKRDIDNSGMPEAKYVEVRRMEAAVKEVTGANGDSYWVPDEEEDMFVEALPVYQPHGWEVDGEDNNAEWAIVHFQGDDDQPMARDLPTVEEYVLVSQGQGIAGDTEGTHKYTAYNLDPNQPYMLVPPPGDRPGTRVHAERFWDPHNNVIVNRWYVEPVSEYDVDEMLARGDVKKAEQGAYTHERRDWRESDVIRDALGRFADEPDVAEQEEAMPARRVQRTARAKRTVRRASLQPTQAAQHRETRRETIRAKTERPTQRAKLDQAVRRAAAQRITQRAETEEDLPVLFDADDFKVFTEHQWSKAIHLLNDDDVKVLFSGGEVALDPITRRVFAEASSLSVDELPHQLAVNVDNDPSLQNKQHKVLAHMQVDQAQDVDVLAARIERLFDDNPQVDKLELFRIGNTLRIAGNVVPVGHQSILEVDPEIDWVRPVSLVYAGQYRAREMGTRTKRRGLESLIAPTGTATSDNVEGVVANPTIHLYRIATKHYRAANVEPEPRDDHQPYLYRT